MSPEKIEERIASAVIHFRNMELMSVGFMLAEIKHQFADMAKGGDGGDLGFEENGERTCRGINYKNMPDSFFEEVIDLMRWE
jgi:hypothetical protein